jgi:Fe-S cluster assembly protein SufD
MPTKQNLLDSYLSNIDIIGEGLPVWFNARRSDAAASLNLNGLPNAKQEQYLHSNIERLVEGEWEQYFVARRHPAPAPLLPEAEAYRIELRNGRVATEGLCVSPEGAVYGSLRAAACSAEYGAMVEKWLDSAADMGDAPTAMTRMFVQDGAFVYLPASVEVQTPIVVDCAYHAEGESEMCFAQALVVADEGARGEVIVTHRSAGSGRVMVGVTREVIVGRAADVHFTELYDLQSNCSIVNNNYIAQMGESHCSTMCSKTGEGYVRAAYNSSLTEPEAVSDVWSLYLCSGEEHCDINMAVRHLAPDCRSYSLVKGVAAGTAVGSFAGMVYVAQDAQRTDAQQQSRNLLLSDTARIFTQPQLEIYADDVKCTHGATVGQLDDEAIYYMRQRGLSEQQARRLQIEGFAYDVVQHCGCPNMCRHISELTAAKLEKM